MEAMSSINVNAVNQGREQGQGQESGSYSLEGTCF